MVEPEAGTVQDPIWKRVSQISAGLSGLTLGIVIVVGTMLHHRMDFDYDAHGLFQDPKTLYVYSRGTLLPLWIVFGGAGLFSAAFFWVGRRVLRFET